MQVRVLYAEWRCICVGSSALASSVPGTIPSFIVSRLVSFLHDLMGFLMRLGSLSDLLHLRLQLGGGGIFTRVVQRSAV